MGTMRSCVGPLLLALALAACSPRKPAPSSDDLWTPPLPSPPPLEASLIPPAGTVPASAAASAGPDVSPAGKDFAEEAKILYRVAACAGDAAVPAELDAAVVEAHCKEIRSKIEAYRSHYVDVVKPYLAALKPPGLPKTVVYPFGGGDLATALTTYPEAREITTISLELAGDPRRLRGMTRANLEKSLKRVRVEVSELLLREEYSRSETLKRTQRGDLPGELSFFLVGLAVHGFEPVSLRYFTLTDAGEI